MEETYIIVLIIAILILILYFVNFSGNNSKVDERTNGVNGDTNVQQIPSMNQFKPYNPTENFGSCGMPVKSTQPTQPTESTQLTQTIKIDATGKASLKVHVAMWCGWSKRLLAQLDSDEFKNKFNDVKDICVLEIIDCEKNKKDCDPSIVKGFPTIILQTKSNKMVPYNGDRSTDDIIKFIKANSL